MPRLVRGPLIEARSRFFDSAGWDDYQPRADDIIIATYPKCGTTWTQRIVGMLVFQSPAPFPVQESSPWPDFRMPPPGVELALAESQAHRRFLKTHLPFDALPVYAGVKVIHVARDGRDAAMSFYNHKVNFTDMVIERATEIGMSDPRLGTPYRRIEADPARHFRDWLAGEEDHLGDPACGFWHLENSYWTARHDPDMLLVHHADMKKDLAGEMRRIAEFLGIEVAEDLWPQLVEAAGFEAMKRQADELMPGAKNTWEGGGNTFLNKGTNGRWRDVFTPDDLAAYDRQVREMFEPELAAWIEHGRLGA
jgi:aryl sulfotransferase